MSWLDIQRSPDYVWVDVDNGKIRLQADSNGIFSGNGIVVTLQIIGTRQNIRVKAPEQAVHRITLQWSHSLSLVATPLLILGDHWERGYGDLEWRGIVPERILPWYFLTHDGKATHGYGVLTGAHSLCYWQLDTSYLRLHIDVRCGHVGVKLGQKTLEAATIVSRKGDAVESPFSAAKSFCGQLCASPAPLPSPVYGGNNWYYAYGRSSHEQILEDATLISSLSDNENNRPYMVIDDGWQLCSGTGACNGGPWTGNYAFPDMAGLAQQMTDLGVKPGIWFRPLLTNERVPDSFRRGSHDGGQLLDPSIPEVLDMIAKDVRQLVSWGYKLIKHDFTSYDLFGRWGFEMGSEITTHPHAFADRSQTTAQVILGLYKAIAEASGESVIIGCNTIGHLAAGLFEMQRTGDDTSGKEWKRTRKMGINTLAFRMAQHGTFFAVDADCVGVTQDIPWSLNKQWLALLAGSGTPLFVSLSPDAVTAVTSCAIREAFHLAALPSPVAEPLDWLSTTCPARWKIGAETVEFDWFLPEEHKSTVSS